MAKLKVNTIADYESKGEKPDVLFWVGCAGSFDDRAKKITRAFIKILNKAEIKYAVLGKEESCTGDPAKRSGNEFLFQMQAMMNIQVLNGYGIQKNSSHLPSLFQHTKKRVS
jgi:Fe-S oxidoreductase